MIATLQLGQFGLHVLAAASGASGGFVLIARGLVASAYVATSEKYSLGADTTSAGTTFTGTNAAAESAATATATKGYYGGGYNGVDVSNVFTYTWSGDTVGTGTTLTSGGGRYCTAFGNTIKGIFLNNFGGGGTGCKYTYSGDTVATSAAGTRETFLSGGTGNDTVGVWAGSYTGGTGSVLTGKYTYSGDTTANGTNTPNNHYATCGMSSLTVGYFAGNTTGGTAVSKYTYSGDTTANGGTIGVSANLSMAGSDASRGIICGGGAFGVVTVSKYLFSSDATATGTNLTNARTAGAGACSTPGGL